MQRGRLYCWNESEHVRGVTGRVECCGDREWMSRPLYCLQLKPYFQSELSLLFRLPEENSFWYHSLKIYTHIFKVHTDIKSACNKDRKQWCWCTQIPLTWFAHLFIFECKISENAVLFIRKCKHIFQVSCLFGFGLILRVKIFAPKDMYYFQTSQVTYL